VVDFYLDMHATVSLSHVPRPSVIFLTPCYKHMAPLLSLITIIAFIQLHILYLCLFNRRCIVTIFAARCVLRYFIVRFVALRAIIFDVVKAGNGSSTLPVVLCEGLPGRIPSTFHNSVCISSSAPSRAAMDGTLIDRRCSIAVAEIRDFSPPLVQA
jgi:hypothetical protein